MTLYANLSLTQANTGDYNPPVGKRINMKISIPDYFREFYDTKIFYPIASNRAKRWFYIDNWFDTNVKIDKLFESVDRDSFKKEMIAVHVELVGLAFVHNIKKEEQVLNQSLFTQEYLQKNALLEIWDIMGNYNKTIALSMEMEKDEKAVMKIREQRQTLFKEYMKKYHKVMMDRACIERISNREGSEGAWKRRFTLIRLTAKIAERIRYKPKTDQSVLINTMSTISGFYEAAKGSIQSASFR